MVKPIGMFAGLVQVCSHYTTRNLCTNAEILNIITILSTKSIAHVGSHMCLVINPYCPEFMTPDNTLLITVTIQRVLGSAVFGSCAYGYEVENGDLRIVWACNELTASEGQWAASSTCVCML